jgi:hypothetical protein
VDGLGFGSSPGRRYLALLAAGLLGASLSYALVRPWALGRNSAVAGRAPNGYLICESRTGHRTSEILDLRGSFGSDPGEPLRRHFGGFSSPHGRVFFSYQPQGFPGIPDPGGLLLFRIEGYDGKRLDFVRADGDFGTVYECTEFVLTYAKDGKARPGPA